MMIKTVPIQKGISRTRLVDLLERVSRVRMGVLGDFTLDGYWYADMTRAQLSRETPLYPHPVVRETYSCGGAANVAWNLCDLGLGEVRAFTILGEDWRGQLLRAALQRVGVRLDSIVCAPGWLTPFFGKVILTSGDIQQEDSRLDFINTQPPPESALRALLAEVEGCLPDLDGVVVADYQQVGIVSDAAAGKISALASQQDGKVWVIDSRERLHHFHGLVLKPNDLEAARLLLPGQDPQQAALEELARVGIERQREDGLPLYITLGSRGCLVLAGGAAWCVPAAPVSPPLDTVGAGDTFLSALAAGLSAGASSLEAGCLANLAGAVTVRKLRITGTASPAEILKTYEALSEQ